MIRVLTRRMINTVARPRNRTALIPRVVLHVKEQNSYKGQITSKFRLHVSTRKRQQWSRLLSVPLKQDVRSLEVEPLRRRSTKTNPM
jgi:hypothetical protein